MTEQQTDDVVNEALKYFEKVLRDSLADDTEIITLKVQFKRPAPPNSTGAGDTMLLGTTNAGEVGL